MSNLNFTLSKIYENLFVYFNYKKFISLDDKIDNSDFIQHIYNNQFFIINTTFDFYNKEQINTIKQNINNKNFNNVDNLKITFIVIFHYNSDIYNKTDELKKFLIKLKNTPFKYDVILITKNNISTHVNKYIFNVRDKISIINYTYKLFSIIIPEHILSNKHIIIYQDDELDLLNNVLFCKKNNLPKISINDPQIIWSHGRVNDIVKIIRFDDITGLTPYYRVIIN